MSGRTPIRPIPTPGAPPPGAPHTFWSTRGAATGATERRRPSRADRWLGALFLLVWRMAGLVALPFLTLHPRARRHIWRVPVPVPGWTWLHGASAGEHTAARALATCVTQCWPTSSSWRTPVAGAFAAPLDLPFVFARWLDRARPGRLVLIEGALWPGWLAACRRRGIPVSVVNARPGRGTARWRKFGPLWRWLTADVQFIGQKETGDLKLSAALREATLNLGREAIVAASTRPGDEQRMLTAWRALSAPRPLLVMAPRHLSRVPSLCQWLDTEGVDWCQRTVGLRADAAVMVLDTMGELATLFAQARVAFVGGTFDERIGGHSPAEAFAAGTVVIHGPHTNANPVAWTQGMAIKAANENQLANALRAAISLGRSPVAVNEAAARCAAMLPPLRTPRPRPAWPILTPLVPLVTMATAVARARKHEPQPHPIPVVVVGGLVAGGAGRTPAVAWLAEQLTGAWVVSAGYRRQRAGPGVRIGQPGTAPEHDLGDELEMLRRRGIPVVSAPDRSAGVRAAHAAGARLVLVDGGLGDTGLPRDSAIVCVDAHWPQGRGAIPVGQRRLPWSTIATAQAVWVRNASAVHLLPPVPPQTPLIRVTEAPVGWIHRGQSHPLDAVKGPVHVAVGIAHPERFVCALLSLGLEIASLRCVRDHGHLADLKPGTVVTEKDAARLPIDADIWALRLVSTPSEGAALCTAIEEKCE